MFDLDRYNLVLEYLRNNPGIFSRLEEQYLLNVSKNIHIKYSIVPNLPREVYDELNIIDDKDNIYLKFISMLENAFNYETRNILEVGGGVLPRLGERISLKQTTGKITIYDPRLSIYKKETNKFRLVREKFTRETNIGDTDLIIGLMPCKSAEDIVEVATKNRIDFMVALCEGGPHGDEYDFYEDEEEWQSSLIRQAKKRVQEQGLGKLKVKYMENINNPYPVIYNDRN